MTTRRIVVVAAVLTAVGIGALLLAGGRGALDGPNGTAAFQRLVGGLGGAVDDAGTPRDGATFVLLEDRRTEAEAEEILGWVAAGGRAVVADPTSPVAAALGVSPAGFVSGDVLGVASLRPGCAVPEVVDVEEIRTRAVDMLLAPGPADRIGCFPSAPEGAYAVVVGHGEGRVVILGGSSVLWNEFLDDADNAAFAVRAVGGAGTDVVMGAPVPDARPAAGPWHALPSPARTIALGIVLAAFVFVLARWRRLGYPPEEHVPSPIPASALVDATGALLRSSGDLEYVASALREHHARRLRGRLGLAPDLPVREVGRTVDQRLGTGHEAEQLFAGPRPHDDEQLLRLARDLQRTVRRTEEQA